MDERVLAMYDIRGIQNYIYRNPKIRDAIGASAIVDGIIEKALEAAAEAEKVNASLNWYDENGPIPFRMQDADLCVLYIGGGNAYVLYANQDLCVRVNQRMSMYVLRKTYSLQLAAAFVPFSGHYQKDYRDLQARMQEVKATMTEYKPLGALPVMRTELKTGYPAVIDEQNPAGIERSSETILKDSEKWSLYQEGEEKFLENLIREKGEDSTIAVVHMDGNNMGLRIRGLIKNKETYEDAVDEMRAVSFNIANAYRETFEQVRQEMEKTKEGKSKKYIRPIIVAGDDITYVCTASVALQTVRRFCELISGRTMTQRQGETPSDDEIRRYGFSVCGGIAYINSHFPFDIAYDTAEALCDSAKKRAKLDENKEGNRTANFVDFQICKDVRCRDLEETRQREYTTAAGETLLLRPLYIQTSHDYQLGEKLQAKPYTMQEFDRNVAWFTDPHHIPRSFAKRIRNTYSAGEKQLEGLCAFLRSRGWEDPEGKDYTGKDMFEDIPGAGRAARYFDALEMMDIEDGQKGEEEL